jgi:hypothetical protein
MLHAPPTSPSITSISQVYLAKVQVMKLLIMQFSQASHHIWKFIMIVIMSKVNKSGNNPDLMSLQSHYTQTCGYTHTHTHTHVYTHKIIHQKHSLYGT